MFQQVRCWIDYFGFYQNRFINVGCMRINFEHEVKSEAYSEHSYIPTL